jgi:Icc-related predicted phosphoesterase
VVIDEVTFHAATMWTDYKKSPEEMKSAAAFQMNDHAYIFDGSGAFTPDTAQKMHASCKRKLSTLMKGKDNSKTVIVTHHLPTYKAVHAKYGDSPLNGAFASDLDAFILKHQPAYWFFGHTHDAYNGTIGRTQLVCNPVGYPNEKFKNNGFHPSNVFTI